MDMRTLIAMALAGVFYLAIMPYLAKRDVSIIELVGMKNVLEIERKALVARAVVSGALYAVGLALFTLVAFGMWIPGLLAALGVGLAATAIAYANFRFAEPEDGNESGFAPQVRRKKSVGARIWRVVLIISMVVAIAGLIDLVAMLASGMIGSVWGK